MRLAVPGPTSKGPTENFTGDVYVNMLHAGEDPSRLVAAMVRFAPGARTHWHSHPFGQTLHCTDGMGLSETVTGKSSSCGPETPSTPRPGRNTGTVRRGAA
jgi:quercetin dioxygenase-like cupin family protein